MCYISEQGITTAKNSTLIFTQPYTKPEAGILLEKKDAPYEQSPLRHVGVVGTSSCNTDVAQRLTPSPLLVVEYEDVRALASALEANVITGALICGMAQAMVVINN